jgi:hypothetical protein
MKKLFPQCSILSAFSLLITLLINACSVEDLTKDLTIYTGNTFLVNPISIQVGDAAHLESVPEGLIVSIEGRDKAKIFTLLGESKIEAVSGIVSLTVKSSETPTVTNPLEFTLILSAPNYVTIRKNYLITRNAELSTDKISMVNLLDTPEGVSVQNTSFTSTALGTEKDIAFVSPMSNGKYEHVQVNMNAGTQALAADGSILSGTVQTQLVHYDARSEASLKGIPEGFSNLTVKIGGTTGKTLMSPSGFYSLSMTAGNREISKFSQALDVTMDIDENYYSTQHSRKIQAGDVLDVISRKETEAIWTAETKATVVNVGGQLKVNFKQAHLSIWVLGELTQIADICTRRALTINSDLPTWVGECTARAKYTYKVVNAKNMNIIYKEGSTFFNNGEILDDSLYSDNKIDINFVVFDAAGKMVYVSPPQNLCANPSINVIGKLPVNKSIVANINVSGVCTSSGGISTVLVPDNVNVWFRNMATPANTPYNGWAPLVTVLNGKGCAKGLVAGESYDFALPIVNNDDRFQQTFSKCLKQPKGLKIPETGDLVITVKSPVYKLDQVLTIKRLQDGVYEVNYDRYPLPTNICDELNNRYSTFIKKVN